MQVLDQKADVAIDVEALKPAHYRRLNFIFQNGRPIYPAKLSVVDLDLMAVGLIERHDPEVRSESLRIKITAAGERVLKLRLDQHRAVCNVHHSLGGRLAHWLREKKGLMTWENATFHNGNPRRYLEGSWTEVRVDVFACNYTPTARLAKAEAYEVKVSLADFRADLASPLKMQGSRDISEAAWYCAPEGLIPLDMLPEGLGLICEVAPGEFAVAKRPKRKKGFIPDPDTLMTLVKRRATLPENASLGSW